LYPVEQERYANLDKPLREIWNRKIMFSKKFGKKKLYKEF
jgi:hypothetical protein